MSKPYFVAQVPKLLEARSLCLTISGIQALVSFNLSIDPGEIVAVVGPSGSGKSTLLDLLCGLRPATSGILQVNHRSIRDKSPVEIARAGVIRCFRQPRLFWNRTALDNVIVGFHRQIRPGLLGTLLRSPGSHRAHQSAVKKASELLRTFDLADQSSHLAADLDLKQRKRLEMARAMATGPRILLLDDPGAGTDPAERASLAGMIRFIRERFGIGICFVDDSPDLAMLTADQVILLDHGHTLAVGAPAEFRADVG